MTQPRRIALLGQPNSGKSTVFNALTGAHQHVGNWPGKTVEKKEGSFAHGGVEYLVADLPGAYSLSANSDEEIVTRDYIAGGGAELVCILADASQLERSLFMLADYVGIRTPALLVLTMMDVAKEQGRTVDTKKLADRLGIPVVGLVAPERKNYGPFFAALEDAFARPRTPDAAGLYALYRENLPDGLFEKALAAVPAVGAEQYSAEWLAGKLIEGDAVVMQKLGATGVCGENEGSLYTSDQKFRWIGHLLDGAVKKKAGPSGALTKFDRLAISKRWGKWVAVGIILLGLVASMVVAMPIMLVGSMIPTLLGGAIGTGLGAVGVAAWLIDFINDTFITAIGWTLSMLGFVFGINLVFGLIEEVGYMARVSYVFDDVMSRLGLQGKSIMPMLVGFGCTIGGAAGTRVIDSWGQKVLTIALVWAVPCGATFAVIPTLASAFFGWGGILVMLGLFAIMFLHIWITAKIFGAVLSPKAERTGLIMELPPYHKPRWGALLRQTVARVWSVFQKAFVVVVLVAAVFWLLSYSASGVATDSLLYRFGVAIEPATRLVGLSWQTFMAFISSMVSKEAVLGVLSALYAGTGTVFASTTGAAAADANIGQILSGVITKPEALAFIVSVTFNVPCTMAVASTYQESHSLKWTLRIALYYFATALLLACVVYHVAGLFW